MLITFDVKRGGVVQNDAESRSVFAVLHNHFKLAECVMTWDASYLFMCSSSRFLDSKIRAWHGCTGFTPSTHTTMEAQVIAENLTIIILYIYNYGSQRSFLTFFFFSPNQNPNMNALPNMVYLIWKLKACSHLRVMAPVSLDWVPSTNCAGDCNIAPFKWVGRICPRRRWMGAAQWSIIFQGSLDGL